MRCIVNRLKHWFTRDWCNVAGKIKLKRNSKRQHHGSRRTLRMNRKRISAIMKCRVSKIYLRKSLEKHDGQEHGKEDKLPRRFYRPVPHAAKIS